MSFIAKRIEDFDSGYFRSLFVKQSLLESPIDLSVGIPEETTAEHIKLAGIRAINDNHTTYTPVNGLIELREKIAKKLKEENNINATPDTVTIVPGLTTGQLLTYFAILDPEDEIIILDPYYPPYMHLVGMTGAYPITVSTLPTFQPDIPAIEASITDKTKAIVINSPNNPTGAVYPESTLRKIAYIAEEHNILLIADEIYEHFVFEGKHFSVGSIYPNTLTMNGFSKEFAMTGWRLGYIHGPLEVIEAINEIQQYAVFASSSIAQYGAIAALEHRPQLSTRYKVKRDFLVSALKKMGFEIYGAQGSFYVFVKAPFDLTDSEFVDRATAYGLIIVPGRAFSKLHGYVRLSYGTDMKTLRRGVNALEKLMVLLESNVPTSQLEV
ncbi:MAG: pyridoxal phosphate-dependent aminotransferase [Candidatus Saccharimonadales bacterium]